MLVDRVHQNVVDDTRLPVPGLQATDASRRAARRLEQRVVHPRQLLEFPAEQALIELLHLLRFLDVELDVHNRSGFWSVCHDDTFGPVEAAGGFYDVREGARKVREPMEVHEEARHSRLPSDRCEDGTVYRPTVGSCHAWRRARCGSGPLIAMSRAAL